MAFEHTDYEQDRFLPKWLEERLARGLARLSGVVLIALVAVCWASLLTWSVKDPSLSHTASGTPANIFGMPGAILSDLLLQTFGIGACILLIPPTLWAAELVADRRISAFRNKISHLPLSVLLLAGALSMLPQFQSWPLPHGFGGIIGDGVLGAATGLVALVLPQKADVLSGVLLLAAGLFALGVATGIGLRRLVQITIWPLLGWSAAPKQKAASEPVETAIHSDPMEPTFAGPGARSEFPADDWSDDGWHREEPQQEHWPGDDVLNEQWLPREPVYDAQSGHSPTTLSIDTGAESAEPVSARGSSSWHPAGFGSALAGRLKNVARAFPGAAKLEGHAANDADDGYAGHGEGKAASPQFVPYDAPSDLDMPIGDDDISVNRGEDFDRHTEHATSEMARRFAPNGGPRRVWRAADPSDPDPIGMPGDLTDADDRAIAVGADPGQNDDVAIEDFATPPPPQREPVMPAPPPNAPARAPASKVRNPMLDGMKFHRGGPPAYKRPSLNLLKKAAAAQSGPEFTERVLRGNARLLEDVLGDFGIKGEVRDIRPGPVVTLFEFEPARGVKSSRVIALADDIARSMSATAVRIGPVPGRNVIGIELPNQQRETVLLRAILETKNFGSAEGALPIALGKSIGGEPVVADLARMPHLLVAGTTGSGKSVGVNAMVLSLLYRYGPDQCRLLMIDPKMLELSVYNGIPHLLSPVVTDPALAVNALNWVVGEMEERYKRMAKLSVRSVDVFNNRVLNAKKRGERVARTVQTGFDRKTGSAIYEHEQLDLEPMPYIVVVIDEFADLMMVAGKEVEGAVQRLAQMARAAGIHLIMATQRPSVDVITGTIKANFPTRVSFKVASRVDSRTILGEQGAEQLLGQGDMLYSTGSGQVARVHGPYVSDEEVEAIANALRTSGKTDYIDGLTDGPVSDDSPAGSGAKGSDADELYDRAVATVLRDRKASTSYLQRRLSIGYNRAADLIERMETEGLISAANASGKRDILAASEPTA